MILLTGATGFLGGALCESLVKYYPLRISVRKKCKGLWLESIDVVEAVISPDQDWVDKLSGISVVIHCAARAHILKEVTTDPLVEFRRVNVAGTLRLARQASEAGVRRFIFLSSIKVNGENSELGSPFNADQIPLPSDPYGISKHEAEMGLKLLSEETGMEVVVIRPPLVYGPGVKANFHALMHLLQRGIPLPFGGLINNQRSYVFLGNLVDLIITCIKHPAAANQIFLVSDDEDLSTTALLQRLSLALGRPAKLIAVPVVLIILGLKLIGRADITRRLCGSLQVDVDKTKELLSWNPPVSLDEGLRLTAAHFLKMHD